MDTCEVCDAKFLPDAASTRLRWPPTRRTHVRSLPVHFTTDWSFDDARRGLREIGFTLLRCIPTRDGVDAGRYQTERVLTHPYRVAPIGADPATVYYADDLVDAVESALDYLTNTIGRDSDGGAIQFSGTCTAA